MTTELSELDKKDEKNKKKFQFNNEAFVYKDLVK